MLFIHMRLVELKWSLAMLFGCAVYGLLGVVCLSFPYVLLVGALLGLFGMAISAGPEDVFPLFFALGVVVGLSRVAEHFIDGFRGEMEPLRRRRSERRHSKIRHE